METLVETFSPPFFWNNLLEKNPIFLRVKKLFLIFFHLQNFEKQRNFCSRKQKKFRNFLEKNFLFLVSQQFFLRKIFLLLVGFFIREKWESGKNFLRFLITPSFNTPYFFFFYFCQTSLSKKRKGRLLEKANHRFHAHLRLSLIDSPDIRLIYLFHVQKILNNLKKENKLKNIIGEKNCDFCVFKRIKTKLGTKEMPKTIPKILVLSLIRKRKEPCSSTFQLFQELMIKYLVGWKLIKENFQLIILKFFSNPSKLKRLFFIDNFFFGFFLKKENILTQKMKFSAVSNLFRIFPTDLIFQVSIFFFNDSENETKLSFLNKICNPKLSNNITSIQDMKQLLLKMISFQKNPKNLTGLGKNNSENFRINIFFLVNLANMLKTKKKTTPHPGTENRFFSNFEVGKIETKKFKEDYLFSRLKNLKKQFSKIEKKIDRSKKKNLLQKKRFKKKKIFECEREKIPRDRKRFLVSLIKQTLKLAIKPEQCLKKKNSRIFFFLSLLRKTFLIFLNNLRVLFFMEWIFSVKKKKLEKIGSLLIFLLKKLVKYGGRIPLKKKIFSIIKREFFPSVFFGKEEKFSTFLKPKKKQIGRKLLEISSLRLVYLFIKGFILGTNFESKNIFFLGTQIEYFSKRKTSCLFFTTEYVTCFWFKKPISSKLSSSFQLKTRGKFFPKILKDIIHFRNSKLKDILNLKLTK